ncbi:MAG: AAA family ATPase [Candidatus Saccharimonadales bacterium]
MRQLQALRILQGGESVFLTGPPGAGKTYVLNQFIKLATKQGKNVAVTASTGIAATHIGGTTIHSWSGLGIRESLSDYDRTRLRETDRLVKRYNAADVLVIDEVSMLHGRRLDMVNEACKLLRSSDEPFGGLQVVLVGDLFQLPPINRGGEPLDFAHMSAAWQELDSTICYLTEQHRQNNDGLLDLLQAMRRGDVNEVHEAMLQERLQQKPTAEHAVTRLYSHNIDVETINDKHLKAIDRDAKVFTMRTSGSSAKVEQLVKSVLAPAKLELKIDAEVMFVANNFGAGFVNGTRGTVVAFHNDVPVVELLNGREVKVEPHSWSLEEDGKKRAEVAQLPLRLAWAITIHKSQGMSLDAAEIDLSRSFTPGMGYVALSRVRSIGGVFLNGINQMALAMHPQIFTFDEQLRSSSEELSGTIEDYEAPLEEVEAAVDTELLHKLKDWRLVRAANDEVPAYIIAHNSVLEALAQRPPTTLQALNGIKGFGPKKIETYGPEIIAVIAEHQTAQQTR